MFKKLTMWLFFTIIAGILPLGFKWAVCGMTGTPFTYDSICSEIFFFNLIISADGLKELYDVDTRKNLKVLLFASMIFVIIIIAVIYGILLLNDCVDDMHLQLETIYSVSGLLTVLCVSISFCIQLVRGEKYYG